MSLVMVNKYFFEAINKINHHKKEPGQFLDEEQGISLLNILPLIDGNYTGHFIVSNLNSISQNSIKNTLLIL